jgi:hypothetical protein
VGIYYHELIQLTRAIANPGLLNEQELGKSTSHGIDAALFMDICGMRIAVVGVSGHLDIFLSPSE